MAPNPWMGGLIVTSARQRSERQARLPLHIVDLAAEANLRTADGDYVELRPRSFAVLRLLAEDDRIRAS